MRKMKKYSLGNLNGDMLVAYTPRKNGGNPRHTAIKTCFSSSDINFPNPQQQTN